MQKTVFITGASSGFGKATALLFQQQGWNVVASMRTPENDTELSQLENVLVTRVDVQDDTTITAAVSEAIARFGNIDVLVNNAGYGAIGALEAATKEQVRKIYEVNVLGVIDMTKAVLPHMREKGAGTIINISSFGGVLGMPLGSLYNSSKFAVEGFSEALFFELSPLGIGVKIVEPGGVNTNFRNSIDQVKTDIPVYNAFLQALYSNYPKATEGVARFTVEDVAGVIYKAATDGKKQLRYVAGGDAQFFIDKKFKQSEADYIAFMEYAFPMANAITNE